MQIARRSWSEDIADRQFEIAHRSTLTVCFYLSTLE
jgi:hypothetical protein